MTAANPPGAAHLGSTLRMLRIDAGLTLRELAGRIGVSTAYLSRVENGHDAAPTVERLAAIARELDVPSELLLDLAQRVSPFLAQYLDEVPEAGTVFLEIARRRLGPDDLGRLRALVAREFPAQPAPDEEPPPALAPLLSPDRLLLQLQCGDVEDALDLASPRLLAPGEPPGVRALAAALRRRESEAPTLVGRGVAVPHTFLPGAPRAALITLVHPLPGPTPDGVPVRVLVVLAGPEMGRSLLLRLAHLARLAGRGLADALLDADSAQETIARVAELERIR